MGIDSRVTKLKAPGSTVEWIGREGGTNRPIRGWNRDQACGYSQFVVSLQSKSLLSIIDRRPAALCDVGLVV